MTDELKPIFDLKDRQLATDLCTGLTRSNERINELAIASKRTAHFIKQKRVLNTFFD